MSHHLDSPLARQDSRLDITDLYVFRGEVGTVFVLNVNNSISGLAAPQGFHPEARYALRIDFNGDAIEDLTYRLTFGERDADGQQSVELRRLRGRAAQDAQSGGTLLAQGMTNQSIAGADGECLWAGLAGDPFYIDPTVLKAVGNAFAHGQRIELGNWHPHTAVNLFDQTTVHAIVLEVPDAALLGRLRAGKRIGVWATTKLATDAGDWQPINRVGHPMMPFIFHAEDDEAMHRYNTTVPAEDLANYGERFAQQVAAVVAAHGTATDPAAYATLVVARLLPDMLPYQIGTSACYGFACYNGRALTDNAPETIIALVTNAALSTGLTAMHMTGTPRATFPYVALPPE